MASSSNSSAFFVSVPGEWWEVPVIWCGGEDGGQDVCIRLVRNQLMKDQEAGRSPVLLALIAAHSDRLLTNGDYFRDMAQTFQVTPLPTCTLHQVTIHVDEDDIIPYIDCFKNMYNPPGSLLSLPSMAPEDASLQDVRYTHGLLLAATHIGYDALRTSVHHHMTHGTE